MKEIPKAVLPGGIVILPYWWGRWCSDMSYRWWWLSNGWWWLLSCHLCFYSSCRGWWFWCRSRRHSWRCLVWELLGGCTFYNHFNACKWSGIKVGFSLLQWKARERKLGWSTVEVILHTFYIPALFLKIIPFQFWLVLFVKSEQSKQLSLSF